LDVDVNFHGVSVCTFTGDKGNKKVYSKAFSGKDFSYTKKGVSGCGANTHLPIDVALSI